MVCLHVLKLTPNSFPGTNCRCFPASLRRRSHLWPTKHPRLLPLFPGFQTGGGRCVSLWAGPQPPPPTSSAGGRGHHRGAAGVRGQVPAALRPGLSRTPRNPMGGGLGPPPLLHPPDQGLGVVLVPPFPVFPRAPISRTQNLNPISQSQRFIMSTPSVPRSFPCKVPRAVRRVDPRPRPGFRAALGPPPRRRGPGGWRRSSRRRRWRRRPWTRRCSTRCSSWWAAWSGSGPLLAVGGGVSLSSRTPFYTNLPLPPICLIKLVAGELGVSWPQETDGGGSGAIFWDAISHCFVMKKAVLNAPSPKQIESSSRL